MPADKETVVLALYLCFQFGSHCIVNGTVDAISHALTFMKLAVIQIQVQVASKVSGSWDQGHRAWYIPVCSLDLHANKMVMCDFAG